ncbi:Chlorinase MJ1651 [Geodia barretti]|uniref:Chlorinase MJ1651 n=1 Tax=Geodia barretti TaxID=519541 RepID=A0AA35W2T7_GEOBA|nr:Chlorinase MJ1651 [Geodia barretti]
MGRVQLSPPPIVLATDFGLADAYVGMMRGVIFSINPHASVIDLTHGIAPQDVCHGAVALSDAHPYFPERSIFVAVVDPGVGTDRFAVLLETPDHRFVAPDNGLLTLVCRRYDSQFGAGDVSGPATLPDGCRAWRLTNPGYWRHPVSATFHGRDVFAPVAAHLSAGVIPDMLGDPTPVITALSLPPPRPAGNSVRGQIVFADAFGNLVSDITAEILSNMGVPAREPEAVVSIAGHEIIGLSRTFHDPPGDGLRALVGSHGRLEVALVDGSASAALGVASGTEIVLRVG